MQLQHFVGTEGRKRFLVCFTRPNGIKTRKLEVRPCSPEDIMCCYDINTYCIKHSRRHKAGNKTSPDQVVKPKLVCRKMRLDDLRRQCNIGRANGFVCIL